MATPYYRVDCENTSHMRKIPCLERKNIFGSYGAKLLIMDMSEDANDNGSVVGVYYVKGGEIRYNPVLWVARGYVGGVVNKLPQSPQNWSWPQAARLSVVVEVGVVQGHAERKAEMLLYHKDL